MPLVPVSIPSQSIAKPVYTATRLSPRGPGRGRVAKFFHGAPCASGNLEPRGLGEEVHRAKGIRRGIGDLKLQPASAEPRGEIQFAAGHRPKLKRSIKLLVETPVQPGRRDRKAGGRKGFSQTRAERYVHHAESAAKAMINGSAECLGTNGRRLRIERAPDLAEVKQGAKTRLSQVQHEMQKLIGGTENARFPPIGQGAGYRAVKQLAIDGNAESLVAEPEMQLDSGSGGMGERHVMAQGERFADRRILRIACCDEDAARGSEILFGHREIQIH